MSNNKESQAARNAADRRLREHFIQEYKQYMQEEHEKRGLTWNPRLSQEEREARQRADNEARALAKIQTIAAQNSLTPTAVVNAVSMLGLTAIEKIEAGLDADHEEQSSVSAQQDEAARPEFPAMEFLVEGKGGGVY